MQPAGSGPGETRFARRLSRLPIGQLFRQGTVGAPSGEFTREGVAALVSSQRFCTGCGHEWRQGSRFCTACGRTAAQDGQPSGLPDENQGASPTIEVTGPNPNAAGQEWARFPLPTVTAAQPAEESADTGFFPQSESSYQQPETPYPPIADGDIPGKRSRRHSHWLLALVVVVVLAAGGTAAALYFVPSLHRGEATSDSHLGTTPTGPASASTLTPSSSPSPSTAAPTQLSVDGVTVDISAINNDPNAAAVARTMGTYFGGIDSRNYLGAWDTLAPSLQAAIPYQPWSSSLSTTRDTHVALQNIRHDPNGDVNATVSFRSHQAPQSGPNPGETCTNWSLDYRLTPASTSAPLTYLIRKVKKVGSGHAACGSP